MRVCITVNRGNRRRVGGTVSEPTKRNARLRQGMAMPTWLVVRTRTLIRVLRAARAEQAAGRGRSKLRGAGGASCGARAEQAAGRGARGLGGG